MDVFALISSYYITADMCTSTLLCNTYGKSKQSGAMYHIEGN